MAMLLWEGTMARVAAAIFRCGICGLVYGAITGAVVGSLILGLLVGAAASLWGAVLGAAFGLVAGYIAGIIGGSIGGRFGYLAGGLIGGAAGMMGSVGIEGWFLYFPPVLGALVALYLGRELDKPDSYFPLVSWAKSGIESSGLMAAALWRRWVIGLLLLAVFVALLASVLYAFGWFRVIPPEAAAVHSWSPSA